MPATRGWKREPQGGVGGSKGVCDVPSLLLEREDSRVKRLGSAGDNHRTSYPKKQGEKEERDAWMGGFKGLQERSGASLTGDSRACREKKPRKSRAE